jgi:signal transduction histidine kinase
MATSELTHIVEASASMITQSSHHAIVSLLRARVESSRELVNHYYSEFKAGHLTEAEARQRATETLLAQRIGTSGYIFCLDTGGIMRAHPKPALVGKDMNWYPLTATQTNLTNHYIEYLWKNPDETTWRAKALYQAYFEPWDWIISASSYREEFNGLVQAEDFRKDLLSIKVGKTGYLTLIDTNGNAIIHPKAEGRNLLSERDVNGHEFVKEIIKNKTGLIFYTWRSPDESNQRKKIAAYKAIPEFGWFIVSSAYEDELFEPLRHIRHGMLAVFMFCCLLALGLSTWFSRGIVSTQNASEMALRSALQTTGQLINAVPFALVTLDHERIIRRANEAALRILKDDCLCGKAWDRFLAPSTQSTHHTISGETTVVDTSGTHIPILLSSTPVEIGGESLHLLSFVDLSERRRLESELRNAQKLEAIGRLAAGIAHEINTPAQFISDNIRFLQGGFTSLQSLMGEYQNALALLTEASGEDRLVHRLNDAEQAADIDFLKTNIPSAITEALEGVSRISTIVRAMKEFASAEHKEKLPANLNHAMEATLTVTVSEYRHVAEVEQDFGDLPDVCCNVGEIKQVFFNLVVNAAHAIAAKKSAHKGVICIRSRCEEGYVRFEIQDSGCGIAEKIRERIFDPFFTTREVGQGSGQGLAIARSIVVDKHNGSLTFTTETGKGSTFIVRIPLIPPKETSPKDARQN